ncbi:hypothetical protein [Citricoccus sp. NR2]|uniref:hypothetical protein n=1 Tax=Citricoccus sp. NR2 TaxID=3004095 RepID=UPI0022DE5B42|nr:hypothetical protein [Citricoccus sp. NR2]WBL18530.1 hypothetical protein O1A05_12285 [Citricoccus sp. NR2]
MTEHDITDEDLFGVPDIDEDDIDEADRVSNAVPLDATEQPIDDDAEYEEADTDE